MVVETLEAEVEMEGAEVSEAVVAPLVFVAIRLGISQVTVRKCNKLQLYSESSVKSDHSITANKPLYGSHALLLY